MSRRLLERLTADDIRESRGRSTGRRLQDYYGDHREPPPDLPATHFGIWLNVPAVLEKVKLGAEQPPEDVHAMARGALAAAGGLYEADMVVDALAERRRRDRVQRSALDFGCSSGRARARASAAYPEIRWHGCDPNEPAIAWAQELYPRVDFSSAPTHPPLPLADGSLDLIYAISIWSHFAPELGLAGWRRCIA